VRSYTRADFTAIGRVNKVIFDILGLAWIGKKSTVLITGVGRQFLKARSPAGMVSSQVLKYHFSNPSFGRESATVKVFPHLFLLDLLLEFPEEGISRQEYILLAARARTSSDLEMVSKRISRFRELSEREQRELIAYLKTFPIVKKGRLTTKGRRSSIYNTIALNSSYSLGFFAFPRYMAAEKSGRIVIPPRHLAEAVRVARTHGSRAFYTEFANEKDWFGHYGDPLRSASVTDAMEYYESRSDVDNAVRAFVAARDKGLFRKIDPSDYKELRVREKMLEDLLELNLCLLEAGLALVGRQYAIPTGPIDLLVKDSKRRYVVIELKKGRASDKVVGQLQRYRGYILQELARPGQRVRGMIVSQSVDKRLKYAVSALRAEPVQLFKFLFQADVREVK